MCRYATSGYGLVGTVLLGGWLDLMILEVFSNLWFYNSMILAFVSQSWKQGRKSLHFSRYSILSWKHSIFAMHVLCSLVTTSLWLQIYSRVDWYLVEIPYVRTVENIFATLEISKEVFVVIWCRQLRTGSYEDRWMVLTRGLFTDTISN